MDQNVFCLKCGAMMQAQANACTRCGTMRNAETETTFVRSASLVDVILPSIRRAFARGLQYSGRAPAYEYWWTQAFFVPLTFFVIAVTRMAQHASPAQAFLIGVPSLVLSIVCLFVSLALGVRRLHDTGRSWVFLFLAFVPFIGGIALLALFGLPSENRRNKYGDPDHVQVAETAPAIA